MASSQLLSCARRVAIFEIGSRAIDVFSSNNAEHQSLEQFRKSPYKENFTSVYFDDINTEPSESNCAVTVKVTTKCSYKIRFVMTFGEHSNIFFSFSLA